MSGCVVPPSPLGNNWKTWGERLNAFLLRNKDTLTTLPSGAEHQSATVDGILMWDAVNLCPIVSKDGVWVKIKLDP